jgi:hypothetical protein
MLAIPSAYFNLNTLAAAMRLPQAFFLMVTAMFKTKDATKTFLHTEHSTTVKTSKISQANSNNPK